MTPIAEQLTNLGLRHTAANLDDLIAMSTKRRLGPLELIELLVEHESQYRAKQGLERRLARSRIGRFKAMADYEWDWPKRIDRDAIESALRLEFLDGGRNIVLVAPQGLGKTMIARNIANQAVLAGHSVLCVTGRPAPARPRRPELGPRPRAPLPPLLPSDAALPRRDRLSVLRRAQRRLAVPGDQPPLRTQERRHDH